MNLLKEWNNKMENIYLGMMFQVIYHLMDNLKIFKIKRKKKNKLKKLLQKNKKKYLA